MMLLLIDSLFICYESLLFVLFCLSAGAADSLSLGRSENTDSVFLDLPDLVSGRV